MPVKPYPIWTETNSLNKYKTKKKVKANSQIEIGVFYFF